MTHHVYRDKSLNRLAVESGNGIRLCNLATFEVTIQRFNVFNYSTVQRLTDLP
jgi:hypothetical protein